MVSTAGTAYDHVEAEVRELVRRRGLDPVEDRVAMRRLVDEVVADYDERALTSALPPLVRRPDRRPLGVRRRRRVRPAAAPPRRPDGRGDLDQRARPGVRRQARPLRADDDDPRRRPGPRPRREDAQDDRPPRRPVDALRRRDAPRRLAAARRHPRHHPPALVGQHPQVRPVGEQPRRARRAAAPSRRRRPASSRPPSPPGSTSSSPAARRRGRRRCSTAWPPRSPAASASSPARRSSS